MFGATSPSGSANETAGEEEAAEEEQVAQPPSQPPIYKMWAEKLEDGSFAYHGNVRGQPHWELLEAAWVAENLGAYATWLETLRANGACAWEQTAACEPPRARRQSLI